MIKFKELLSEIHDVESLTPKDIYNFYYLWHTSLHNPAAVQTPYGKEVQTYYLNQLKSKYVKLFTKLLAKQVQKYVKRGRVDQDFPVDTQWDQVAPEALVGLMKKTFRSDMTRRNDLWELVGSFVVNLSKAQAPKDMFLWINQLNNAVHNTQGKVLDKLPNYYTDLNKAFDAVDKAGNIEALRQFVDKDIRDLKNQEHEMTEAAVPVNWPGKKGLEKIVMAPHLQAQLDQPAGPASSASTSQPAILAQAPNQDEEPPSDSTLNLGPLQEAFNEGGISQQDRENLEFMTGLKKGVQDKAYGQKRDISSRHPDWQRGYKTIRSDSWWHKFNDKLTRWAAEFGNSYGRR
jgi:hypothetical protein